MDEYAELFVRLEDGEAPVLWVSGELDIATAPALRETFQDLVDQRVTVDLSELRFLDSSGLAALISKHNDGGIILRGVRPMQMKILQLTGLDGLFEFDGGSPEA